MSDAYLRSLLGKNEQVLFITRQHWLVLAGEIMSETLLTIAFITLITILLVLVPVQPLIALGYLLLLFPLVSLSRDVLIWSNRKYVVTTRRVIQLHGVFDKQVADSSLEKVNDVKMAQSFMGRLLDYGDIEILTASELGINKLTRIGRPIDYKSAMINAKEKLEHPVAAAPAAAEKSIPALIAQLEQLRQQGVLTAEEFQQKKNQLLSKL